MPRKKEFIPTALIGFLWLAAVLGDVVAADQPQWGRGWTRNLVSGETGLPDSFDPRTGRNIRWAADLGTETHATPVVADGRVFIGTNNHRPRDPRHQGDRGVLMCLDEQTGRLLWQLVVPKIKTSVYWDWPGAGICSTPAVEGDRVYLVTNRGEVMCLDVRGMANGNDGPFVDEARHSAPPDVEPIAAGPGDADIIWCFDLIQELGVRQHDSAHGSPLLHGPFLYVNTSNGVDDTHKHIAAPEAPSLVVLDRATGRLVATDGERIGPRIFHATWSSPALAEANGRPQIIFCGGDGVVYAFEPVSAPLPDRPGRLKKIWWFDCDPAGPKENVHQYNGNRTVSPSNIMGLPVVHGSRVHVTAGGDLWWGKREVTLMSLNATQTGDVTRTARIWSQPLRQHSMSSPAIAAGLVFVGDSGKRIHCMDAETGRPYWTHDVKGEMWSSPLVADGKVYCATRRGEFLVFAADREKKLLGTVDLGSPVSACPVAANGVLYVTTMKTLYAVRAGQPGGLP
jgi:outer membrane protein assembly factor BamB